MIVKRHDVLKIGQVKGDAFDVKQCKLLVWGYFLRKLELVWRVFWNQLCPCMYTPIYLSTPLSLFCKVMAHSMLWFCKTFVSLDASLTKIISFMEGGKNPHKTWLLVKLTPYFSTSVCSVISGLVIVIFLFFLNVYTNDYGKEIVIFDIFLYYPFVQKIFNNWKIMNIFWICIIYK